MHHLAPAWLAYAQIAVDPGRSRACVAELRTAFMAGAEVVFRLLAFDPPAEGETLVTLPDTPLVLPIHADLRTELQAYAVQLAGQPPTVRQTPEDLARWRDLQRAEADCEAVEVAARWARRRRGPVAHAR